MKKIKHIIFFLLLFSSFKSEGQIEIGLKLGNGISKVNFPNSFGKELYTYSGQLGFYGVLSLSEKIFFQNEILFNQLEGRMKSTINFTGSNGQPIGEGTLLVQTHQSYLSIPFKLGFEKNKTSFLFGLQTSFEFYNQSRERLMNEDTSLTPSSDVKRKFNAPKYDIGSVVEFKYKISKTLFLGFHGYLSFKNLIHQDGEVLLAKHQFLVNVYYKLYEHSNDGE